MNDKWKHCSKELPPKTRKFLFSYIYGIGIGSWENIYSDPKPDSPEGDDKTYLLTLFPKPDDDPKGYIFEHPEEYMVEIDLWWMELPDYSEQMDKNER